jgi:hypothetical protein
MPIRAEVQRRAEYLERAVTEGRAPLWAVIAVVITLVGGSIALSVTWGAKHLIWTLVIILLALLAVLAEGSYRVGLRRDAQHAAPTDPEPSAKTGLEIVIDDEKLTPFPRGRITREREREWERLPPRIKADATVYAVHVTEFAWDPTGKLPGFTLIVGNGSRNYEVRPIRAAQDAPES